MAPPTCRLLTAALVLLLLLLATNHQTTGAVVVSELRCHCTNTQGINFETIQSLTVTPAGPHCTQIEVIATLKDGQKVCLNPQGPRVQKIIQKILKNAKSS